MVLLSVLIVGSEPGADLEEIWGNLPPSTSFGRTLGLPLLVPVAAVCEPLELPGDEHPLRKRFFLCIRAEWTLMSAERLQCGVWSPSRAFPRQQTALGVPGSLCVTAKRGARLLQLPPHKQQLLFALLGEPRGVSGL